MNKDDDGGQTTRRRKSAAAEVLPVKMHSPNNAVWRKSDTGLFA